MTQGGTRRVPIGHGASLVWGHTEGSGDHGQSDGGGPGLARKARGGGHGYPYRKPTPVGGCESTEVGERTFVKELGKLTP